MVENIMEELIRDYDGLREVAKREMMKAGSHMPLAILHGEKERYIFPLDMSHKQQMKMALRDMVKKFNIQAYFFISEIWMREVSTEKKYDGKLPSECDDRVEGLYVAMFCRNGDFRSSVTKVQRADENNIDFGDEVEFNRENDPHTSWNVFVEDAMEEIHNDMLRGNRR